MTFYFKNVQFSMKCVKIKNIKIKCDVTDRVSIINLYSPKISNFHNFFHCEKCTIIGKIPHCYSDVS